MVKVVINLDSQNGGVYFAGETISGTIEVNLSQPEKFRALSFVIHGRAKCHWTESEQRTVGHGDNRRTETHDVHYEGKNVYLHTKSLLFGNTGGQPIELPSGIHRYNFQFPLPALIPASFEGSHGNIRYRVEAELDVPWGFDKEFKLQFTVARKDDLNFQPELKIPIRSEDIKKFCCWCCESDPLITTITLPFGGFVPGQDIPVMINYVNKSDVEVERTRIYLQRITKFNSSSPSYKTKIEQEKVAECFFGGVLKLQNKDINAALPIPSLMPISNGMYCNVVQVSYELKIEVITQGCHMDVELEVPIIIGSIPLLMDPSSVQPTFNGQSVAPAIEYQPVHTYSDAQVISGNSHQNTAAYPPNNYYPDGFNYTAPSPGFNPGFSAPYPPAKDPPYDQPPTFDEAVAMKVVPDSNTGNIPTGWKYPTMSMPMPSGPPMMPPYPVTAISPSAPSAPANDEKH